MPLDVADGIDKKLQLAQGKDSRQDADRASHDAHDDAAGAKNKRNASRNRSHGAHNADLEFLVVDQDNQH